MPARASALTFTVTATDGSAATASDTVTITINGTNDGPTVTASPATAFTEDADASAQNLVQAGTVSFGDIDGNDVVDISAALSSSAVWSGGIIDPTLAAALEAGFSASATGAAAPGSVTWNYNVAGVDLDFLSAGESISLTFTVTATDGSAATASDTVTITINGTNDGPVITGGPDTAALPETDAGLTSTGTLTVGDVDTTDTVTASVDSLVVSGTSNRSDPAAPGDAALLAMFSVAPTAILNNTQTSNTLNWTFDSGAEAFDYLAAGETLVLTYTVRATDDAGVPLSDTETVTITITGSNDGPTAVADTATTDEDTALTLNVVGNDADLDTNDVLTVSAASISSGLGTVSFAGGSVTYDPGTAYNGLAVGESATVVVDYTVSDGNGGASLSTLTITVTGSNDGPVLSPGKAIADLTATEDAPFSFQFAADTFADADLSDTLTYSVTGSPAWLSFDALTRTFSGTPANADVGSSTITLRATDGSGAFAEDVFVLTVANTNDLPVLAPIDLGTVAEDVARSVTPAELLAGSYDDDGDALTVTNLVLTAGQGSVAADTSGGWTFTPGADWSGVAGFSFDVSDGSASVTGTATLTVTAVNDAPQLTVPSQTATSSGGAVAIGGLSVTDVDSGLLRTALSVQQGVLVLDLSGGATVASGANSTAVIELTGTSAQLDAALSTLVYRPAAGQQGEDVLTIVASDSDGATFTATVGIVVTSASSGTSTTGATPSNVSFVTSTANEPPAADPISAKPDANPVGDENADAAAEGDSQGAGEQAVPPSLRAQADGNEGIDAPAVSGATGSMASSTAARREVDSRVPPEDQPLIELISWDDKVDAESPLAYELGSLGTRGMDFEIEKADVGGPADESTAVSLEEVDIAEVAVVSFTAGFVWWLTRSGGMLTMMLMGIPAWRHVDLLPVLARDLDDADPDLVPDRKPEGEDTAFEHSAYEVRLDELFQARNDLQEEVR